MKTGLVERLRAGLARTREVLNSPVEDLWHGRRPLDAAALESIEEGLLAADLGLPAVSEAMETLRERSGSLAGGGAGAMRDLLREEIRKALDRPAGRVPFSAKPWVVFVVGVNGDGSVGGSDFTAFRLAFGSSPGDANYRADLDFNGGGIGGSDFTQFRLRFGNTIDP